MQTKHLSRRDFGALLGWSAAGIGGAAGQVVFKPIALPIYPSVGAVRVASVKMSVLPNPPPVMLANKKLCELGLAAGIHIGATVEVQSRPGTTPANLGTLRFLQLTHYHYERTPSFAGNPNGKDCARSRANWELDGQYPYLNISVRCNAGPNTIKMADSPHVPTEAPGQPDETLTVAPGGVFQTWLIWEQTDNNQLPSTINPPRLYPLARVDWVWNGTVVNAYAKGTNCDSMVNTSPVNGWNLVQHDSSTRVTLGKAAGMPPPLKLLPSANLIVWGPC
ncbi:MAG TPA: hypothetical protein VII56_11805 [Rhizomicrobium sp.]